MCFYETRVAAEVHLLSLGDENEGIRGRSVETKIVLGI